MARDGSQANAGSFGPALKADGAVVALASHATNLVPGDTYVNVDDEQGPLAEPVALAPYAGRRADADEPAPTAAGTVPQPRRTR